VGLACATQGALAPLFNGYALLAQVHQAMLNKPVALRKAA
jgi:hypothetical protein